jgi:cell wall-associated NlpC family hydrolase
VKRNLAGQGYPFDNLQYSAIAANTPVFISHISKDRAWVLVESHYGVSWLPAGDVAYVDQPFVDAWETGEYITLMKDDVSIIDESGIFRFKAPLGSLFPKAGGEAESYRIKIAANDGHNKAVLKIASVSKRSAAGKPLRLTTANIAAVTRELMNETYGWGGMYRNRDCSALIKDMFAPFGLWLPRNSGEQAASGAVFVDLTNLSPAAKEKIILEKGKPFLTLLWLRGHIMLYIGRYKDQPVVFHSMWGIKTRSILGKEGRKIIGRAAVTTLHPGIELPDIDLSRGDLLDRIEGIVLLVP